MTRYEDFATLNRVDLVLDCVYAGGLAKNFGAEPLRRLLPVGNQGGFRPFGSPRLGACKLVALFTTGVEADWPDYLDERTGSFTYFGDNRSPGAELASTQRKGNRLLAEVFAALHASPPDRARIPPFFVFERSGTGWDVKFRGLAVPGGPSISAMDDLVAVWKSKGRERFQNYKATFTVLDCPLVSRAWIDALEQGEREHPEAPEAWARWVATGRYSPLSAPAVKSFRLPREQMPQDESGKAMLRTTYEYFRAHPHEFERCAADLWTMVAPSASIDSITRRSRDGGRDALGRYSIGPAADRVDLSFALEAKCYQPSHGASVRDMARLISRIKHREFGVFVTTSFLSLQAYEELREDRHPVVVLSGGDIVNALKSRQTGTPEETARWLSTQYPR